MATSSLQMNNRPQIRSLSLPSKLEVNPINYRIEEKLRMLKAKEEVATSTSEKIFIGLSGLADLYKCVNDVLALPFTQQALSLRPREKCVVELLKGCSILLNVCRTVKEIVLQHNEVTKELISSLHKSKVVESDIASYNCSRKEIIKRTKQVISTLNQLDDDNFMSSKLFEGGDYDMSAVITSQRCVSIINLSVCETLLAYMSMPLVKAKRSVISKLVNKGSKNKCEGKSGNEFNDVDFVLQRLVSREAFNEEKSQVTLKRLIVLGDVMKDVNDGLETVCKELTETKACLMNVVSF